MHLSHTRQCLDRRGLRAMHWIQNVWPLSLPSDARSSIIYTLSQLLNSKGGSKKLQILTPRR